jgi:hypothetical protein
MWFSNWSGHTGPLRRNDYPATCYACGERVEKGQGTVSKSEGKWAVCHGDPCPNWTEDMPFGGWRAG